jgi:hypothetical protein
MSNPFKVGDKVTARNHIDGTHAKIGAVFTVVRVYGDLVDLQDDLCFYRRAGPSKWHCDHLRAAIAGQDYEAPTPQPEANSGHLSDGSSVQKHSAGPIYPCVITLRDKRLKGTGLFDYGLTSPRNPEPLWFSTLEAAHGVADIINKDIAP